MDEVYVYQPETHAWRFVNVRGKKPSPRYLHTAVAVEHSMLVFGGTDKNAGDVWSFNFIKLAWTRLSHVSLQQNCVPKTAKCAVPVWLSLHLTTR